MEGSNDGGTNYTTIAGGLLGLPAQRNAAGGPINVTGQVLKEIDFPNSTAYTTYQLVFTNVNDDATASNGLRRSAKSSLSARCRPVRLSSSNNLLPMKKSWLARRFNRVWSSAVLDLSAINGPSAPRQSPTPPTPC